MHVSDTVFYFAYGANTSETKIKRRRVKFKSRKYATLPNYELKFNKRITSSKPWTKGSGAANVVHSETSLVEGFLYELTVDESLKLDKAEGYPKHYNKVPLQVECEGNTETAIVYVAVETDDSVKPCKKYLDTILESKDEFSDGYSEFLASTETID